ncbi:MAG: DUF3488 domain-containing protein [Hydrogenophilales bacterium]|nr:DUF3488 domain-containing protein [Hydrogenophilales bacterium]
MCSCWWPHFLDSQNLMTAAYMIGGPGLMAGLIANRTTDLESPTAARRDLALAGQMLLQALPLALLLFLLFPHLHGPL